MKTNALRPLWQPHQPSIYRLLAKYKINGTNTKSKILFPNTSKDFMMNRKFYIKERRSSRDVNTMEVFSFPPFVSIGTDIGLRSPKQNHDIESISVTSVDINSTLFLTFLFQDEVIFDGGSFLRFFSSQSTSNTRKMKCEKSWINDHLVFK
jgi:hypothetical protein